MDSMGDLSENASEADLPQDEEELENKSEDESDSEEKDDSESEDEDEQQNNDKSDSKKVTFKDDEIQQVYNQVNDISKNIDQFLEKLHNTPQKNLQNNYRQHINPLFQQNNYLQTQQLSLPWIKQNQSNPNRFFYTKQDMTQAKTYQMQNNNSLQKNNFSNRRLDDQLYQSQLQQNSSMNTSKFNYYGEYRFEKERQNQSCMSKKYLSHFMTQQQTLDDAKAQQQFNQNINNSDYFKNIQDVNKQIDYLAQSINLNTESNFYQLNQNSSKYNVNMQRKSQISQRNSNTETLNKRSSEIVANQLNYRQNQQREFVQSNTNKNFNHNSFYSQHTQNINSLYRRRPKRVFDESELYGDIQQTFIPNRISKLIY